MSINRRPPHALGFYKFLELIEESQKHPVEIYVVSRVHYYVKQTLDKANLHSEKSSISDSIYLGYSINEMDAKNDITHSLKDANIIPNTYNDWHIFKNREHAEAYLGKPMVFEDDKPKVVEKTMDNLEPGDKIICIDNSGLEVYLKLGKEYTFEEYNFTFHEIFIRDADKADSGSFMKSRFEPIQNFYPQTTEPKEKEMEKPKQKFEVRDYYGNLVTHTVEDLNEYFSKRDNAEYWNQAYYIKLVPDYEAQRKKLIADDIKTVKEIMANNLPNSHQEYVDLACKAFAKAGEKINGIKFLRSMTGVGLREAKNYFESL